MIIIHNTIYMQCKYIYIYIYVCIPVISPHVLNNYNHIYLYYIGVYTSTYHSYVSFTQATSTGRDSLNAQDTAFYPSQVPRLLEGCEAWKTLLSLLEDAPRLVEVWEGIDPHGLVGTVNGDPSFGG